jgi:photosystem II stability/assembly factor-like uncharacterized protein
MRSLLVAICCLFSASTLWADPSPFDYASLRAVQFVDAKEGWAVGDQGVIWHTIDGGKTWERQVSGTKASLRGICFLSPYQGYVVGRNELPNRVGSVGVLLMTTDGGSTWKTLSSSSMPGLQVVKFFDEKNGLAAGDHTDLFPLGVFTTQDGGLTWKPLDDEFPAIPKTWTRFVEGDAKNYVLQAGRDQYGTFKDGVLNGFSPDALVVGSAKPSWKAPVLPNSGLMHASHFVDEKLGWAVGDLGNIQHTQDGGKNWTMQKSGGQRATVLCIHAKSESTSLPLISLLSGKEGHHAAAITCNAADEQRLSAALRMVGGNFAREFDLRLQSIMQGDFIHEPVPKDMPQLLKAAQSEPVMKELITLIQQLKPEVIICDNGATLAERWILLHLTDAVKSASVSATYGEMAHTVKKVYAVAPEGEVSLDLTTFHPELGSCLLDFSEPARHLFSYQPSPSRMCFKLINSTIPGAEQHKSILQGIDLAPGGTGRRKKEESSPALIASLPLRESLCKTRREMEALFAEALTRDRTETTLVKCLELLQKVPDYSVPTVAVNMGFRFAQAGQWTAAREMFAGVAEHHAVHSEAVEALRWLVKYQSSSEVRRRLERGDFPIFQKAAFTPVEAGAIRQMSGLEEVLPKPSLKFMNPEAMRQWNQVPLDLQPKLAAFGTMYSLDMETLLPLNVVRRNLGLHARALGILQQVVPSNFTYMPTKARLMAERNILDNKPIDTPLSVHPAQMPYVGTPECVSVLGKTKPVLDGKLDDDCWKSAKPLQVPAFDLSKKGYRTKALFTHDDKFLYVALMCEHPEGQAVEPVARKEQDSDLRGHDRVELVLDLDRDYTTAYRLAVDHRGLVHDECWGDSTWNPKWFVAHQPTAKGWVAELAIPFSELSDNTPSVGSRWAMGLVRVVPGVGQESWGGYWQGQPSTTSMGLLNFKKD